MFFLLAAGCLYHMMECKEFLRQNVRIIAVCMRVNVVFTFFMLLTVAQAALAVPKTWKVLPLLPTIETKQEITAVPPAWDVITETLPHWLVGITIFAGPPEQKAALVPHEVEHRAAQNTRVALWTFSPSSREDIWLAVSYASTSVVLVKSLPEDITELRVIYNTSVKIAGMDEIVRLEYR